MVSIAEIKAEMPEVCIQKRVSIFKVSDIKCDFFVRNEEFKKAGYTQE